MDTFVKRFQPDRYKLWLQGRDVGSHPEDPKRSSAAPLPSKKDILCNKNNNTETLKIYMEGACRKRILELKKKQRMLAGVHLLNYQQRVITLEKEIENIDEDLPDKQQLKILEVILLKAKEIDEARNINDGCGARIKKKRGKADASRQKKRPRKEKIKTVKEVQAELEIEENGTVRNTVDDVINHVIETYKVK